MRAFVRQLGSQPGVQLNPLQDNSDGFAPDNSDQIFGIALRASRGRIDRPFRVNRNNVLKKLGAPESIRISALNEAKVQLVEALKNGAAEAVVHRLHTSAAAISYIVATAAAPAKIASTISAAASDNSFNDSANGFITAGFAVGQKVGSSGFATGANNSVGGRVITALTAGKMTFGGTDGDDILVEAAGAAVTLTALSGPGFGDLSFSVASAIPGTPYVFALKHLDCHNDGVSVLVHADNVQVASADVDTKVVNLKVKDADGNVLLDVTGSFDSAAVDDFGKSYFLPDVLAASEDVPSAELTVAANATIRAGSNAYGRDSNGLDKTANSGVLSYFSEGTTVYGATEYAAARDALTNTEYDFAYVASGGSQSTAFLAQLAGLAYDTNRQLKLDVSGSLTPTAAIAFVNSLDVDSYYVHFFWAPLECDDPINGGKAVIGTSAFNIARACARNAVTDANGFAKKNQPIAGKAYPLNRTGIRQLYTPDETELSDLAKAKINPVILERYNGGSSFVFTDSLTSAKTEASFRKLIAVADMSSSIDETVTRAVKEFLQLPMSLTISRTKIFLKKLFENAQAAKWITPSVELDGASFQFNVVPNTLRPADKVDVTYTLHYDGTTRQITVTQTLSR